MTHISGSEFEKIITDKKRKLVCVKFGADWCPPCRMMESVIGKIIAEKTLPEVEFFEVNIDSDRELAERYQVESIPTFIFFYAGEKLFIEGNVPNSDGAIVGGVNKTGFEAVCKKILNEAKSAKRKIVL